MQYTVIQNVIIEHNNSKPLQVMRFGALNKARNYFESIKFNTNPHGIVETYLYNDTKEFVVSEHLNLINK